MYKANEQPSSNWCAYRLSFFNVRLSFCLSDVYCSCGTFVVPLIARAVRIRFPQKPGVCGSGWAGASACFVAHHPGVVAIAGMLWFWWCGLSSGDFFVFFSFRFVSFFLNVHGLLQECRRLASFTSIQVEAGVTGILFLSLGFRAACPATYCPACALN